MKGLFGSRPVHYLLAGGHLERDIAERQRTGFAKCEARTANITRNVEISADTLALDELKRSTTAYLDAMRAVTRCR